MSNTLETFHLLVWLFLWNLRVYFSICFQQRPRIILDLGSGFSSAVFRLYMAQQNVQTTVYSVDDDPLWLNKTRDSLKANNLSQII